MDIKNAIELLSQKYPGRIPIGYWLKDDNIIFNTRPIKVIQGLTAPSQFAVTSNGDVYGINPIMFDLSLDTMRKI